MIEESGIAKKVYGLFEESEKAGKSRPEILMKVLPMEAEAVHFYLKQLTDNTPAMNCREMMYYCTALALYTEHTWKAVESIEGGLEDFYDIIKQIFNVKTFTASIDTEKAEKEMRDMRNE